MRDLSKTIAAIALLALATPAAADAQPKAPAKGGAAAGDVRCLLTMVALGQQKDRQQAAQLGVYFFAGRLSARSANLDLGEAMRAEAGHLDAKTLEAESRRCGPMITGSVQNVQNGLNALKPPGAATPAAPPTPH